jgi:hypothetical protein
MKTCYANDNTPFFVDDDDFERVSMHNWYFYGNGYLVTSIKGRNIRLHRFIMNAPMGMDVDHINGDSLNNSKTNLRICTHQENQMNQTPRKCGTSKYKGVHWGTRDKKWISKIMIDGNTINLGYFNNEIEAALAYNVKAQELFGEYARLNIIWG